MTQTNTLRASMESLRLDLEQNYQRKPETKKVMAARRELQGQIEAAHYQLAELEETDMIEQVKKQVVDSKMVEHPAVVTTETKQCRLCNDAIVGEHVSTSYYRFWCCGATCCGTCIKNKSGSGGGFSCLQLDEFDTELVASTVGSTCPICQTTIINEAQMVALLGCHVEKTHNNTSWAQFALATILAQGLFGLPIDTAKAAEFFQKAADNGHLLAMVRLGQLWGNGLTSSSSSSRDKAAPNLPKQKQYLLQAARQGLALAQYLYAELTTTEGSSSDTNDSLYKTWNVLAADQGLALAQCALGNMYVNLYHQCTPNVLYKAIYWLKKAARLGHVEAALPLSLLLLDSKALVFDAKCDVAGYSAIPEANYWFELGTAEMEPHFVQRPRSLQLLECGNCGKSSNSTGTGSTSNEPVEFKRCIKCKGVRYCGRDCQALHWAAGHKRDCKAVEALRDSMKGISATGATGSTTTTTGTGARL